MDCVRFCMKMRLILKKTEMDTRLFGKYGL